MMKSHKVNINSISPYLRHIHCDDVHVSGFHVPWRRIYDYEMIFLQSGYLDIKTETESYRLEAGDIHIMHPFVRHMRRSDVPLKQYSLHFDLVHPEESVNFSESVYLQMFDKDRYKPEFKDVDSLLDRPYYVLENLHFPKKLSVVSPILYARKMEDLIDIFKRKRMGYEMDLKIGLLQIISYIWHDTNDYMLHATKSHFDKRIMECIEYLNSHLADEINLDNLATHNGLSARHFRTLFRQKTGQSPNEYLVSLRIRQAEDYLLMGVGSVAEVARKVGYQDQRYFSRIFKAKVGYSPMQYINYRNKDL